MGILPFCRKPMVCSTGGGIRYGLPYEKLGIMKKNGGDFPFFKARHVEHHKIKQPPSFTQHSVPLSPKNVRNTQFLLKKWLDVISRNQI